MRVTHFPTTRRRLSSTYASGGNTGLNIAQLLGGVGMAAFAPGLQGPGIGMAMSGLTGLITPTNPSSMTPDTGDQWAIRNRNYSHNNRLMPRSIFFQTGGRPSIQTPGGILQQEASNVLRASGRSHGQGGVQLPFGEIEDNESVVQSPFSGETQVHSDQLGYADKTNQLGELKGMLEEELQLSLQQLENLKLEEQKLSGAVQGITNKYKRNTLEREMQKVASRAADIESKVADIQYRIHEVDREIEMNFQMQEQEATAMGMRDLNGMPIQENTNIGIEGEQPKFPTGVGLPNGGWARNIQGDTLGYYMNGQMYGMPPIDIEGVMVEANRVTPTPYFPTVGKSYTEPMEGLRYRGSTPISNPTTDPTTNPTENIPITSAESTPYFPTVGKEYTKPMSGLNFRPSASFLINRPNTPRTDSEQMSNISSSSPVGSSASANSSAPVNPNMRGSYTIPDNFESFEDVEATQRMLQEAGLYDGAIDGKWGPKSKAAFEIFKSQMNSADMPISRMSSSRLGGQQLANMRYSDEGASLPGVPGNVPADVIDAISENISSDGTFDKEKLKGLAGEFAPYITNIANAIISNKMSNVPRPKSRRLNTPTLDRNYNINPQLENIDSQSAAYDEFVRGNVNNAAVGRASHSANRAQNIRATNDLYAQKDNIERQISNQNLGIASENDRFNTETDYRDQILNYQHKIAGLERSSANLANLESKLVQRISQDRFAEFQEKQLKLQELLIGDTSIPAELRLAIGSYKTPQDLLEALDKFEITGPKREELINYFLNN